MKTNEILQIVGEAAAEFAAMFRKFLLSEIASKQMERAAGDLERARARRADVIKSLSRPTGHPAGREAAHVGTEKAAQFLGVSQRTILRMIERGELQAERGARGVWKIACADIEQLKRLKEFAE